MSWEDNNPILTIYLNVLIGKDFVVFLKLCLCVWNTKFQHSLLLQSSNLETINGNAELSCPEGEGRRGCFLGTKYRFTELLSGSDVVQEQITGKENEGWEKPCERLMFSIMHNSAHHKELWSQSKKMPGGWSGHLLPPQHDEWKEFLSVSFLWGSWDPEGVLWVADRSVGKALQFRDRWASRFFFFHFPSCFFHPLSSLFSVWTYDSEIIHSDFWICHFFSVFLRVSSSYWI